MLVLWIAGRRGGRTLVLAMGVALALLFHAHGSSMLTQAWTPYVPLVWYASPRKSPFAE